MEIHKGFETLLPKSAFIMAVHTSGQPKQTLEKFHRYHGQALLEDLLTEAGLNHGKWTFLIKSHFRCSGQTPAVQVRRAESHGVHIWLKPGDNNSGVKGTLVLTRDRNMTPDQLFNQLKQAAVKSGGCPAEEPETKVHIDLNLTPDDIMLVLTAVQECAGQSHADMTEFLQLAGHKLSSEDTDYGYWLEAMEHLVDEGLLVDKRTHYELTFKGKEKLQESSSLVGTNGHHAPVSVGTEEGDMLLKARDTLSKLILAADTVTKSRKTQETLLNQIKEEEKKVAQLKKALSDEKENESKATYGLDISTLSLLIPEIQPRS